MAISDTHSTAQHSTRRHSTSHPLPSPCRLIAVYVLVSYRLFHVTNDLKLAIVPHDDNRMLARNAMVAAVAAAAVLGGAFLLTQARVLL